MMNTRRSLCTASLIVLCMLATSSIAGIIDTRPPDTFVNFQIGTGSDTAGGTFTADDTNLASFTLPIDLFQAGGVFRAIVLGTIAGAPTGAPLWESADVLVPGSLTEFIFNPNLPIVVGNQYFAGIDTGLRTATAGGSLLIGQRRDNPLASGQWFEDLNGSGFTGFSGIDIASRIVMNSAVPEPTTLALMGLGLAGLGYGRKGKAT